MKYRKLGDTGITVSEIGMGLEHLLDKDEKTVAGTIKTAMDGGVNYFDCHPGNSYENSGDNDSYEGFAKFGRAVKGLRDKYYTSYIAHSAARSPAAALPRFENWLKAVGTDYADVYMIQFCDRARDYEQVTGDNGVLSHALELKAAGKIRHIGISTHSAEIAFKAMENGSFGVLMYPVNPAFDVVTDEEQYKTEDLGTLWDAARGFTAAGRSGAQPRKNVYSECERRGVGIIAMKPFGGGFLLKAEKDAGFTPVNLMSYALAQSGVSTVVPGCTSPREISEILTYYTCDDAARDYSGAVARSRWSVMENCLYCNHCQPCPAGIDIGQVNRLLDAVLFNSDADNVREKYNALPVKASACTACGACESKCPFKVKVAGRMERAAEIFEARG